MALELNYEINNSGVEARYWRILITNIGEPDGQNAQAHLEIAGYATEELRREGKNPLVVLPCDVTGEEFAAHFAAIYDAARAAAYNFIKQATVPGGPDFTLAVDR